MRRKISFSIGYFYHIYNRGVEKRDIFIEDRDYIRFLRILSVFNNVERCRSSYRGPTSQKLVGVLCYCLMPNHFHLILTPLVENGIQKFMQKVNTGYAMYFNEKYKRTGALFEGRYKATIIETDSYFTYLTKYIHLNPLKLIYPEWKEKGIQNWKKACKFVENYRWSSLKYYLKLKDFSAVLNSVLIKNHLEIERGESYGKFIFEVRPRKEDLCGIDRK